jgi:chaperone required for assembly of F1-ATPase
VKRFWKEAKAIENRGLWFVVLDGKPIRTPGRQILKLPNPRLAEAIATEWNDVGENVDPGAMPLTGLANAAIDRVAPDPAAFADGLARYGESDLICYRAEHPRALAERQEKSWDALLGWARRRFDVDFNTTCGVTHVPQPSATIERLHHAFSVLDPFRLAGLSPLVTIGGSLIAGLAVLEGVVSPEQAWTAVTTDEQWQAEQWGEDSEAQLALENRRRDFMAAAQLLALLKD